MKYGWLALLALGCDGSGELGQDDLTAPQLSERVTIDALMGHLEALEAIADDHDGNRSSLSEGYDASVAYIQAQLEAAGYEVTLDPYTFTAYQVADAALAIPQGATYDWGGESDSGFQVLQYSGSGDVTAQVVAVDVTVPPGAENSSTSGCEASDFDGFPAGSIALLQRGTCTFQIKADNAEAAGASAVIVFNEGQPGRREPIGGVLGDAGSALPVVGISYALGAEWVANPPTVHLAVAASLSESVEYNVIAETTAGDPDSVLMIGAHLDSVAAGPGINDNGSGSAFVLELALQFAALDLEPVNKVRFAWWGAEEEGLIGSYHWLYDEATETPDRGDDLMAYLNYDMLASGNGYRYVYDGDSRGGGDAANVIEALHREYLDAQGQDAIDEDLLIPSDQYWFVAEGIPVGGLYSGSSESKTDAMVADLGGDRGEDLDPCYHRACDTVSNTDPVLYAQLAASGAHAVQRLSERTEPLGGVDASHRQALDLPRPTGCHDHVRWDR